MAQSTGDWEMLASGGTPLQGLYSNPAGVLHAVAPETGDIYKVEVGTESGAPRAKLQIIGRTDGHPSALAFDADSAMFIGDMVHKAVLSQPADVDGFAELVTEYEGRLLKGPNTFAFGRDGTLFFTDSGPMGDTSLQHPRGSVFLISPDNHILKPLALESMAHPSGVAVSPDGTVVYVAETLMNRIVRYVQRPGGVYHASVFVQFSGGFGPTALACDQFGRLFVGRFEFAGTGSRVPGMVTVIEPSGKVAGEVPCPTPQITSMALTPSDDGAGDLLYVTESSNGVLYRILTEKLLAPVAK